ncbi:hypothetical protein D3C83_224940 [compost metagenome]
MCAQTPSRSPVFESESWLWPLCASERYRPPNSANCLMRVRSLPIGKPFSMPMKMTLRPLA